MNVGINDDDIGKTPNIFQCAELAFLKLCWFIFSSLLVALVYTSLIVTIAMVLAFISLPVWLPIWMLVRD